MRVLKRSAAVLVAVATGGLLGLPVGSCTAWADTAPSLTVSPSHGTGTTPLTLVYRVSATTPKGVSYCDTSAAVTFLMDAPVLGTAPIVWDQANEYCVATLHTKPPANQAYDTPGPHTIHIRAVGGYVDPLTATYTIDVHPVATTTKPEPTHAPTKAAAHPKTVPTTRAAAAAAHASAPVAGKTVTAAQAPASASDVMSAPAGGVAGGSGIASVPAVALRSGAGGSAMPGVLGVLGALVVGGAAFLGFLVWRRRRGTQPAE